jgi:hypothetical protein
MTRNNDTLQLMLAAERIEVEIMTCPDALSAYSILPFGSEDVRICTQVKAYIEYCIGTAVEIDMPSFDYNHINGIAMTTELRKVDPGLLSYGRYCIGVDSKIRFFEDTDPNEATHF